MKALLALREKDAMRIGGFEAWRCFLLHNGVKAVGFQLVRSSSPRPEFYVHRIFAPTPTQILNKDI